MYYSKLKTKFIIIIYTTNKLTIVEMADIRGVRLRKFKLRKIILGGKDAFSSQYFKNFRSKCPKIRPINLTIAYAH